MPESASSNSNQRIAQPWGIASVLTPAGRSAVAVIAVVADDLRQLDVTLDRLFRPLGRHRFSELAERQLVYGVWTPTGEDVVIVRRPNRSLEIHCHGGDAANRSILASFASAGINPVTPDLFANREFGRWMAEARRALSMAQTRRTAALLIEVVSSQADWLETLERRLEDAVDGNPQAATEAQTQVATALNWATFGRHLTQPRSVVLCGHPNVGKSSLINRLVGFERAIVNPQAGTTRDVVSQYTAIEGWPIELKDTAGLRSTTDVIETIGIEKAWQQIHEADLRLGVVEATEDRADLNQATIELIDAVKPDLIVYNKADLHSQSRNLDHNEIEVSARTGEGLNRLLARIGQLLVKQVPTSAAWYPVTRWQFEQVTNLNTWLRSGDYQAARTSLQSSLHRSTIGETD